MHYKFISDTLTMHLQRHIRLICYEHDLILCWGGRGAFGHMRVISNNLQVEGQMNQVRVNYYYALRF